MKKALSIVLSIFAFTILATTAHAAGNSSCQVVYGGGQVCQDQIKFTINKLVQKPGADYVENLNVGDARYTASQNVNFKIVIQNTGNTEIKDLNVVDHFPQFLTFVAGVGGTNVGARDVNFVVGSLPAGQKVEYVITAKFADANTLPNQAITCVTNNVVATANDGTQASDNAQVCVEKTVGVTPTPQIMEKPVVKNIPATGPEMGIIAGLIPTGLLGFYLRRKSN